MYCILGNLLPSSSSMSPCVAACHDGPLTRSGMGPNHGSIELACKPKVVKARFRFRLRFRVRFCFCFWRYRFWLSFRFGDCGFISSPDLLPNSVFALPNQPIDGSEQLLNLPSFLPRRTCPVIILPHPLVWHDCKSPLGWLVPPMAEKGIPAAIASAKILSGPIPYHRPQYSWKKPSLWLRATFRASPRRSRSFLSPLAPSLGAA